MAKLKKKIRKNLETLNSEAEEFDYYRPKYFGESKNVSFKIEGLVSSFCDVTEWTNGEGVNVIFETDGKEKFMSLHYDELDTLLSCLEHLGYFKN